MNAANQGLSLYARAGRLASPEAVKAALAALDPPPLLSWIEPLARIVHGVPPGPARDFPDLARGLPDLDRFPAEELRLFWTDALVHIVLEGNDARWAAFATSAAALPDLTGEAQPPVKDVRERRWNVVWRKDKDFERFFGRGKTDLRALPTLNAHVREFRQGGRLVAWWLVAGKAARSAGHA